MYSQQYNSPASLAECSVRRHSSVEIDCRYANNKVLYDLVKDKTIELGALVDRLLQSDALNAVERRDIQKTIWQIIEKFPGFVAPSSSSSVTAPTMLSPLTNHGKPVVNNPPNSISNYATAGCKNVSTSFSVSSITENSYGAAPITPSNQTFELAPRLSLANPHYNYSYHIQPRHSFSNERQFSDAQPQNSGSRRSPEHAFSHTNRSRSFVQLPPVKTLLTKDDQMTDDQVMHGYSHRDHLPLQMHVHMQTIKEEKPNIDLSPSTSSSSSSLNLQAHMTYALDTKRKRPVETGQENAAQSPTSSNAQLSSVITVPRKEKVTTLKKNQCHICGRICSRPSTLQTHLSIHTGDKPYKCPWPSCNKCFNVKSNMLRHYKRHECKSRANQSTSAIRANKTNIVSI